MASACAHQASTRSASEPQGGSNTNNMELLTLTAKDVIWCLRRWALVTFVGSAIDPLARNCDTDTDTTQSGSVPGSSASSLPNTYHSKLAGHGGHKLALVCLGVPLAR